MDLSKVFDSLPHGCLIAKFIAHDLSQSTCDLLSSYLRNRHQRIKTEVNGVSKIGVPQGSFLGPLLFKVFINAVFHFVEKYPS